MPGGHPKSLKYDAAKPRLGYACTVAAIIVTGLVVRHPGLGVPWPVAKYGGSILWGGIVFFLVATAAPTAPRARRAGIAAGIAVLVELVRLYHTPWLDDFRLTLAGALLLGRFFSVWNIVAYWTGIVAGVLAESRFRRHRV
ncbi:MAG: DUF2809 domain-containing protein [Methanobacterium sp.]|nr:DUF2809 domain-containing protein [Methanobacterium sp.]